MSVPHPGYNKRGLALFRVTRLKAEAALFNNLRLAYSSLNRYFLVSLNLGLAREFSPLATTL